MSKAVLISIRPEWCELIANGKKTIEVRKTEPKLKTPFEAFKCYIYESGKGRKKVIGEFVCKWVQHLIRHPIVGEDYYLVDDNICSDACLSAEDLWNYGEGKRLYAWYISDLVIYDRPKELSEFYKPCVYGNDDEHCWCFECDKSGYTPDMHIDCYNILTRPPQSWCYVEQLRE